MTFVAEQRLKENFKDYFVRKMRNENFMSFFYRVFEIGGAYVVGGFLRDFINDKPSRDIDVIVDIDSRKLHDILNEFKFRYTTNKHGGVKVFLNAFEADVWSMNNNWAFKHGLVKFNEDDTLNSIAKGCFYNYDSLVMSLNNFNYNLRYYKDFLDSKKLNILQERTTYKYLNPSVEANILRAFYIKHTFDVNYSANTANYLMSKLGDLWDKFGDPVDRLKSVRASYPKYKLLNDALIESSIKSLFDDFPSSPTLFKY